LIRNKKIGGEFDEDLTNNDYVLYTFDIEDWKNAGAAYGLELHTVWP
jgi:hypothetical protein